MPGSAGGDSSRPGPQVPGAGPDVHHAGTDMVPRPMAALAGLVASRICHDLVSPLGAIANGVELLGLSGAPRTPEFDLIAESVENATARMRVLRLAFGSGGPQPVGRSEITRTLAALAQAGRTTYDWQAPGDPSRDEAKAVLLGLLCLEAAMPLGGTVRVGTEGPHWVLVATGARLRAELPAWSLVESGATATPAEAAAVQFTLLGLHLADLGRALETDLRPERLSLRF